MSKKGKIALSIVGLVVVAGVLAWGAFEIWQSSKRGPKPESTSLYDFSVNGTRYDCSRPIDGEWVAKGTSYQFQPSNQEDFQKYCRTVMVIEEYRAVLDILRRDDVSKTIEKYSTTEAWVRALPHVYINDKSYLKRILPAYSDVKIDCIIVVHSPEGTRFFIENGDRHESHNDHQYLEVPASEFLASLNRASDEDVTNFWLGLH